MSIKDQCNQCRFYNLGMSLCEKTGISPIINGISCETYQKKGISLEKKNTSPAEPPVNPILPSVPLPNDTLHSRTQPTETKGMFKHIFSFNGRIRRLEYGLTYLLYCLYSLPMNVIPEDEISAGFATIWLLLLLPVLWIVYAQGAKRCHDIGHSGWWQLIPFYVFWMIFQDGEIGTNQYGDNPKD